MNGNKESEPKGEWLLAITFGPVQDFIAAARRTRDLWFGSWVLSEISKAGAKALAEALGSDEHLIFPAPNKLSDLDEGTDLNVSNVLLAKVPAGVDPKSAFVAAREAAKARFKKVAEGARKGVPVNDTKWDWQVDDAVESYGAWVPRSDESYIKTREKLMGLLAARKVLRDFQQDDVTSHGAPKSSLDGARDSVLTEESVKANKAHYRMRLNQGEQLCAIALTKRLGEGNKRYPSVTRVAVDPWLRTIADEDLEDIRGKCGRIKGLAKLEGDGFPQYKKFPFEGAVFYESRHHELETELGLREDRDWKMLKKSVSSLTGKYGEPSPYVAMLVADGDKMGDALSKLDTPEKNRAFSKALSTFAGEARSIVEGKEGHPGAQGTLIFAGGDDVVALLPTDMALECARKLSDAFRECLSGHEVSLSVGIAIVHCMEPLELIRKFAYQAEHDAKNNAPQPRNALAIHFHPRGGAPVKACDNWSDDDDSLDNRLRRWQGYFSDKKLPSITPYRIHTMIPIYEGWTDSREMGAAVGADFSRLLSRRTDLDGKPLKKKIAEEFENRIAGKGGNQGEPADRLKSLANELLIARRLGSFNNDPSFDEEDDPESAATPVLSGRDTTP